MLNDLFNDDLTLHAMDYFKAVKNRDQSKFNQYFCFQVPFEAVLPKEKIVSGIDAFKESQRFWFEGISGSFEASLLIASWGLDLGYVATLAEYSNQDTNGNPFNKSIYITAIFKKFEGRWYLAHIQNTVLEPC
jgi:ketosteroid isomerase-like protein